MKKNHKWRGCSEAFWRVSKNEAYNAVVLGEQPGGQGVCNEGESAKGGGKNVFNKLQNGFKR